MRCRNSKLPPVRTVCAPAKQAVVGSSPTRGATCFGLRLWFAIPIKRRRIPMRSQALIVSIGVAVALSLAAIAPAAAQQASPTLAAVQLPVAPDPARCCSPRWARPCTATVVVGDDCVGAAQDYDVAVGRFMMLTQLSNNATNQPLKDKATTLSRSDLITFQ